MCWWQVCYPTLWWHYVCFDPISAAISPATKLSFIRCSALPLANAAGTTISCATQADIDSRFGAAAGTTGGSSNDQNNAGANPNGKGGNNNNKGKTGTNTSSKAAAATSTSAAAKATGAAAGKNATAAAGANSGDPQKSLTLDPKVIAKGFANNGQDQ